MTANTHPTGLDEAVASAAVLHRRTGRERGRLTAHTDGEPVSAAELDRFAAEYVERRGLPGAAVAVTLDGETVHTGGYGVDGGGEPLRADTPMRIASLSKSMTALAVMQLVESGDVELDRPVYDYLPDFGIADPRGARITVRQLLDQSSGMSDQGFSPVDRPRRPTSLAEAVAQMDGAGLSAAPGEEWEYHNPNYHVAARLVEVVGGRPFTEYMEEHVFAPAGMDDTSSPDPATDTVPDLARGHVRAYGLNIPAPEPEHFSTGAGGVVSTAEDMARWVILQGDGGRAPGGTELVSAESVELITPPRHRTDATGWAGCGAARRTAPGRTRSGTAAWCPPTPPTRYWSPAPATASSRCSTAGSPSPRRTPRGWSRASSR
jgi:CubicO group peptidase (beta-lactamase class C family)